MGSGAADTFSEGVSAIGSLPVLGETEGVWLRFSSRSAKTVIKFAAASRQTSTMMTGRCEERFSGWRPVP